MLTTSAAGWAGRCCDRLLNHPTCREEQFNAVFGGFGAWYPEQADDLGKEEDLLLIGLFRGHLCRVEETHFEVG